MRAVAVLAVFADHLFGWPSGGFVGVDVFFVLSGFFITSLLIRERTANRKLDFERFYIRRVKRILPSAILVLIATVIGAYVLFPAFRAKETLIDALWAAVFGANIHFEMVGADYFQQSQPPSPLQHYWSLSIEEQFYFVWPALLVAIYALTRRARHKGKRSAGRWAMLGAMAVIVGASFTWAIYLSATNPNAAYFSSFTRVWELGVGALVAIAGRWLTHIPDAVRPMIAYLGLGGVAASLVLIDATVQFPAPWAALPVVSTALVIASFHGVRVRGVQPLTNRVARYFSDTSYTLYLWHWPVIILLESVMPRGSSFYIVALGLALVLTAVTYHFYEAPIRQSDWLLDSLHDNERRWPALKRSAWGGIGGLTAAAVVVSILVIHYQDTLASVSHDAQPAIVSLDAPPEEVNPCFGAPAMLNSSCALRNADVPLQPTLDNFAKDVQGQLACYRTNGQKLRSCTYGYDGVDATRIAIVGDSHAAAILPAMFRVLNANKWQLTTYVGTGCAWRVPALEDCPMEEIQDRLLTERYDVVFTTAMASYDGVTPESYAQAWAPVAATGSRIAVLADNPVASEKSLACLTRVNVTGDQTGECGTPRAEAYADPDPLIPATGLVSGATLLDFSSYYCTADRCPSVIGDVIVYRDIVHLTATFAETLAPALANELRRVLN